MRLTLERDLNVMAGAVAIVQTWRAKPLESPSNSNPRSSTYNTCARQAVSCQGSMFSSVKGDQFLLRGTAVKIK